MYEGLSTAYSVTSQEILLKNGTEIQFFVIAFTDGITTAGKTDIGSMKNKFESLGVPLITYDTQEETLDINKLHEYLDSFILLRNVIFNYTKDVDVLSDHKFEFYYRGSEIVTFGIVQNNSMSSLPEITGRSTNGPKIFIPKIEETSEQMNKLWAFLTVKRIIENNGDKKRAIELALNRSFVVESLTTLVITKSLGNYTVKIENAEDGEGIFSFLCHY